MKSGFVDLHMHIVPDVDDGAVDIDMAIEMLQTAYDQGVRTVFCTSHNNFIDLKETDYYKSQFSLLKEAATERFSDLALFSGCEVLCTRERMNEILQELEEGITLTLNETKYVLTELYPEVASDDAVFIVKRLCEVGYKPILAHVERYPSVFTDDRIDEILAMGVLLQVNLYSLDEEANIEIKERARHLVKEKYASFVGSDAHRLTHRPPKYEKGVSYLRNSCDQEYFEQLCYKNAVDILLNK